MPAMTGRMAMDDDLQGKAGGEPEVRETGDVQDEEVATAPEDPSLLGDARYREALARIEELEGQVEAAAKSAETEKELRREIKGLKKQAKDDRIDFELRLAGARNVKAARAVLADHDGDIESLKQAEPWLFGSMPMKDAGEPAGGTTGLKPEGLSDGSEDDVRRWRELAGLVDDGTINDRL